MTLIYSFGVIHHTPHHTEIRVMLYSKWSWKVFWIIFKYGKGAFWRAGELIRTYSEAQTGCPITYVYSFRDIRRLMSDFEIVEMRKEHIFPHKIDKYINCEYEWAWYLSWMPKTLFRCFITGICLIVLVLISWKYILDNDEKESLFLVIKK